MNKAIDISTLFPKHLFWDVRMDRLDPERDQELIIPRALYNTNEMSFVNDIEKLESVYSANEIVSNLRATKERIDNRVLEMVASRYHVPPFQRYSRR